MAVLALLVPAAAAEGAALTDTDPSVCHAPRLDLSAAPPARFEPGEARTTYVILTNPNTVPGQAKLTVTSYPERWTVSVAETARDVAANGGQVEFTVTILPPARGVGEEQGLIRIEGTLACQGVAQTSQADQESFSVQLAAFSIPWLVGTVAAALLLIATVVVIVLLGRRRSVHVRCEERQKAIPLGGAASYTLHVENRSPERARVALALRGLKGQWHGFLAAEEVELDAGEAQDLWVNLRAPEKARVGDEGRAIVVATRVGNPRDRVTVHLKARVATAAPVEAPPEAPGAQA